MGLVFFRFNFKIKYKVTIEPSPCIIYNFPRRRSRWEELFWFLGKLWKLTSATPLTSDAMHRGEAGSVILHWATHSQVGTTYRPRNDHGTRETICSTRRCALALCPRHHSTNFAKDFQNHVFRPLRLLKVNKRLVNLVSPPSQELFIKEVIHS